MIICQSTTSVSHKFFSDSTHGMAVADLAQPLGSIPGRWARARPGCPRAARRGRRDWAAFLQSLSGMDGESPIDDEILFRLHFEESEPLEAAFSRVAESDAVGSCIIEPDPMHLFFVAPEIVGATLVEEIRARDIRSIAIPALGSGLGGLDWGEVRPRIESAFGALPEVRVLLFEPTSAPERGDLQIELC